MPKRAAFFRADFRFAACQSLATTVAHMALALALQPRAALAQAFSVGVRVHLPTGCAQSRW